MNCSVRQELESSFKDIQIVASKLSEIENKMKSLDTRNSDELEILVNKLAIGTPLVHQKDQLFLKEKM